MFSRNVTLPHIGKDAAACCGQRLTSNLKASTSRICGVGPSRSLVPVHSANQVRSTGSLDSTDLEIYSLTHSLQSSRQQCISNLTRSLGVNTTTATSMLSKQPKLVDLTVEVLNERCNSLRRNLRISQEGSTALLSMYPFLLLKTSGELVQQLDRISGALGVTTTPVCQLIVKQPYILQSSSQALQDKFNTICSAVAPLDRERVAYLLAALPDLILAKPDTVKNNMQSLQQLFNLTPQQAAELVFKWPGLLLRHAEMTQRDVFILANYMGVSFAMTASLVVQHPHLLGTSWQTVKLHFDNLYAFFGDMPREAVVELVMKNPALLPLLSSAPSDM